MRRLCRRAGRPWLLGPVALALALPLTLVLPAAPAHSDAPATRVEWAPPDGDLWQPAPAAPTLAVGARLRTAAASVAHATLPDGTSLALAASTGVRLERADEYGVALFQSAGVTQALLAPSPHDELRFELSTTAAVVSAPPATCPWVRVRSDGAVLVRNYGAEPAPPVGPQTVDQVYHAPVLVLGPDGPVAVPMPRPLAVLQDVTPPVDPADAPLAPCPFASAPDGAAVGTAADAAGGSPASVDDGVGHAVAAAMPLLGGAALTTAHTPRPADRLVRVRNAYGQRIHTPYADGQRMKVVRVPPGYETLVVPGETPAPPEPLGTFAARAAARAASVAAAEQSARAVAAADQQAAASDLAAQLPPALAHLPFVSPDRVADAARALGALPLPAAPAFAQGLPSFVPCATAVGELCTITGKGVFGSCTKLGSMSCLVRVSIGGAGLGSPALLTPGVQFVTSRGTETIACSPPPSGALSVTCTGVLIGDVALGASATIQVAPGLFVAGLVERPAPNALLEPPVRSSVGGVLDTTLVAGNAVVPVGGFPTRTQVYEGLYPGPTLRFRPGDLLRIKLINQLSGIMSAPVQTPTGDSAATTLAATNLHVHGLHVSPLGTQGDNTLLVVAPGGGTNQYAYPIPLDQSSGMYWYHPHFHGNTEDQTNAGMMGAMIVEGAIDRIPGVGDLQDRLMVLHTLQLDGRGGVVQSVRSVASQSLRTINGQYQPTIHMAPGQTQRWRLANTSSNATLLVFLDGHTFNVIATDGNTLSQPVNQPFVELQPAQRAEVLVTCQGPGTYRLRTLPFFQGFLNTPDAPLGSVVCDGPAWVPQPIPTSLLPVTDLRGQPIAARRTMVFTQMENPMRPPSFFINGQLFDPLRVDVVAKLGTVEEWLLTNPSPEVHPAHLHVNPFQVTSINGAPVDLKGYHDTFAIPIGGEFTFRTRFEDFVGTFAFHCHVAFHEDAGMMILVQVVP